MSDRLVSSDAASSGPRRPLLSEIRSRIKALARIQRAKLRAKWGHPGIRNAAWIGVEKIGRMALSLLVGVFVVRQLGPERYGTYAYVLAWSSMFLPIALFGIGENTVRHLVSAGAAEGQVLGTSFVLRVFSCSVAATLTIITFLCAGTRTDASPGMILFPLLSLVVYPALVLEPYFQRHSRARVITLCGLGSGIASAAIKVYGIAQGASVTFFLAAHAFEAILLGAALLAAYRLTTPEPRQWGFNRQLATTLCHEATPIILGGFAILIYNQSDLLLLGILLDSSHEVGVYSAACRVSTMWMFIPLAIITSASPFLYRLSSASDGRYEWRLQQIMSLCVGVAYAFCIPITLFAAMILGLLFGADFADARLPLQVHVWSNIFAILGVAQRSWVLSRGLLWVALQNTVLGGALNLGLNLLVIPVYGAVGAAWTTVLSMAAASVIAMTLRPRTRDLARIEWSALRLAGLVSFLGQPPRGEDRSNGHGQRFRPGGDDA